MLSGLQFTLSMMQAIALADVAQTLVTMWPVCRFELTPERTYRPKLGALAGLSEYKCGADAAMAAYLAHPDVIKAIHVKSGTPGQAYKLTVPDLRPLYTCVLAGTQLE